MLCRTLKYYWLQGERDWTMWVVNFLFQECNLLVIQIYKEYSVPFRHGPLASAYPHEAAPIFQPSENEASSSRHPKHIIQNYRLRMDIFPNGYGILLVPEIR